MKFCDCRPGYCQARILLDGYGDAVMDDNAPAAGAIAAARRGLLARCRVAFQDDYLATQAEIERHRRARQIDPEMLRRPMTK